MKTVAVRERDPLQFLSGGGLMGSLMRQYDWAGSPLGPAEQWPQALRTTVRLMLNTGHPMYIFWGEDNICLYNDAYSASIGPERHPVSLGQPGREVWNEIWPTIGPQIEQVWLGNGATWHVNQLLPITRHGRLEDVYWTYSYSPIDDDTAQGGIGGVLVVCTETTAQVRAVQELASERDQLAQLFEQAPTFMALLQGPEHRIAIANPGFMQLIGHRQVIGLSVEEALPDAVDQGYLDLLGEVFRSGHAYAATGAKYAVQAMPNGPVNERYVDFVYQPIRGIDGLVTGIFVEGSDVTERVLAKLQLENANRELLAITQRQQQIERRLAFQIELADALRSLTSADEVIAIATRKLALLLGAPRAGYASIDEAGELATMGPTYNDLDRVPEVRGSRVERMADYGSIWIDDILAGRSLVVDDIGADPRFPDSAVAAHAAINARASLAVPIRHDGRSVAFMYVHHDRPRHWADDEIELVAHVADRIWEAVERANAVSALRQTDRRKDEFLAMLAHELRNPLAPISAAAELLKRSRLDETRLRQTSDIIGRQVSHMTTLVNDLLDVSRVTRGLVRLEKNPLDLRQIVMEAVEQVTPLIQLRRHHLVLDLMPEASIVMGDRNRMVQVVTNILNNAAKYTPEGGRIEVVSRMADGQLALDVSDNGIGMEEELSRRVFDLFSQAAVTSDRTLGGLGLGLALVKSLVELQDGRVSCHSDGPGKGSRFTVLLPRLPEPADSRSRADAPPDAASASRQRSILVVDDNEDAATMLGMLLESSGFQVTIEHCPRQALERAKAMRPDVCILDIGLPGMDGNELARRLRRQPETAQAVLIAATGYGQAEDRKKTQAAGFDHHLVKPVDTEKLISLLASL